MAKPATFCVAETPGEAPAVGAAAAAALLPLAPRASARGGLRPGCGSAERVPESGSPPLEGRGRGRGNRIVVRE